MKNYLLEFTKTTLQALYIGFLVGTMVWLYKLASHYAVVGADFYFTTNNPFLFGLFIVIIF